ncbi:hypothetical protein ZWY2020_024814 [Hordeum vulgare]|nr:hypothetical protein ZWY2020_024814 [Hordeum vulgare]
MLYPKGKRTKRATPLKALDCLTDTWGPPIRFVLFLMRQDQGGAVVLLVGGWLRPVSSEAREWIQEVLAVLLVVSNGTGVQRSSARNFLERNFLSDEILKISYSPPSSRYNALSIGIRGRYSLIMKRLQSRFDNLQDRYDTLLTDHEKLSYEFLERKLDLEKLRMSHGDLRMENDSLLAQQISASQVECIPPCLKCIERETANSSPKSSNATIATNSSTPDVVSISSLEENTNVTDENAGLKELYVTGMYKSLKGHQTLCDVLKKQILSRNPRKEGIAFERKLNVDGSYWKPE